MRRSESHQKLTMKNYLRDKEERILVHVTRSPWVVDGTNIAQRLSLGEDHGGCSYFLYQTGS